MKQILKIIFILILQINLLKAASSPSTHSMEQGAEADSIYSEKIIDRSLLSELMTNEEVIKFYNKKLCDAIKDNNIELTKNLLKSGAQVNNTSGFIQWENHKEEDLSPLYIAIAYELEEICEILLEWGASPLLTNKNSNWHPLKLTIYKNKPNLLKKILDKKTNLLLFKNRLNDETLLHQAVKYDATETVSYLVSIGVDINAVNKDSLTALMIAAYRGKSETAKIILEKTKQSDNLTSTKDYHTHFKETPVVIPKGSTALHFACIAQQKETARILLTTSTIIPRDFRNSKNKSALRYADSRTKQYITDL